MVKFSDLSKETKNKIASIIEFNESEESTARQNYYELLNIVADEHKVLIKEIIDDEINHTIILMRLAEIYSGNKPNEFESIMNLKKKGSEENGD